MFEYLILDLDDTLYPRRAGLMQAIVQRIHLYMTDRMGFSKHEAEALRKRFLPQYGTMLRGMQVEYTIDADDYLHFVHDVPIEEYIAPDPALEAMLGRLPLPKVIFTNADTTHARRVMARLGVTHHFATIVDIHALDFHCKPTPQAYQRLLDILGTRGEACIIVEDMARNLRPARELFGMTTVIVDGERADGVDYIIAELSQLEELVNRLMAIK